MLQDLPRHSGRDSSLRPLPWFRTAAARQYVGELGAVFTHGADEDVCAKPDQDHCDAESLKSPDADRTYVFAAAERMTTHANELLGDYVLQQIGLNG